LQTTERVAREMDWRELQGTPANQGAAGPGAVIVLEPLARGLCFVDEDTAKSVGPVGYKRCPRPRPRAMGRSVFEET